MRPIKFRGKAVMEKHELDYHDIPNYQGWIWGSLIVDGDNRYIVGDIVEASDDGLIHEWWAKVHPESVGQYTGLKDKNGREIHENNVAWDEHYECYGVVKLDEGNFVYEWENICEDLSEVHDNIEVVGNVYEDKHLLESDS